MKVESVRLIDSAILSLVLWTNLPVNACLALVWVFPGGFYRLAGLFYWLCLPPQS
jgi:hypothetical protein